MNTETSLLIALGVAMLMIGIVYALISGGIDQAEESVFGSEDEGDEGLLGQRLDEEGNTSLISGSSNKMRKEPLRGV